ncbi:hypothetical protein N2152v2_010600 [Parachlorella kessleri]
MAASTVKVAPKKTGTVKLAAKPAVKKAAAAVAKPAAKAVSKLSNGTVKSAAGSAAKKAESAVKKAGTAVQKAGPVAKKAQAAVQKAGTVVRKAGTTVQKAGTQVIGTRPTKKIESIALFSPDKAFRPKQYSSKPPPKILARVEQLRLLSKLEQAGLLSAIEKSGLTLSAIEKSGLLSKAESLGLISAAADRNTPGALYTLAALLLAAGPAIVYFTPDDTSLLIALQAIAAFVCVSGGAAAYGGASLLSTLQKPGQAEQAPSLWVEAVKDAIHDALEDIDPSSVRGIGVSGQQHGLVALDSELKVIRPAKLWCDVESAEEAAELSRLFGTTLVPSFTGMCTAALAQSTKLLWMKRHEPDNFARLAHVLLPHDYINWWLTGRLAMEASDASGTGLFDSENRSWNEQRMTAIDSKLPGCFPELLGPQEVVGTLRPEVAKELGLPEDVLVSPGGGDNAMSALGAGAVQDGTWVLSLGTSGTLFGPSSKAVLDPSCVICPFCDATGKWLPLLCTINCTGVTEEVRFAFDMTHQEITSLAAKEPPGCRGAAFLPYLGGERTPNWPHATGAILGLRPGFFSPGLIYRAAMEGASFSLLAGMRRLGAYGLEAKELRVVGGGSNNQLWRRVLADTFQLPLRFPVEAETAALGAALQGGVLSMLRVPEFFSVGLSGALRRRLLPCFDDGSRLLLSMPG